MKNNIDCFDVIFNGNVLYFLFVVQGCGMEDSSSIKSNESLTTSDEYVFVSTIGPKVNNTIINPLLQSGSTTSELEQTLTEVRFTSYFLNNYKSRAHWKI